MSKIGAVTELLFNAFVSTEFLMNEGPFTVDTRSQARLTEEAEQLGLRAIKWLYSLKIINYMPGLSKEDFKILNLTELHSNRHNIKNKGNNTIII